MPQEGNAQVAVFSRIGMVSGAVQGNPVEIGARGQAIKLLGLSLSIADIIATAAYEFFFALSSNPEHELNPPATGNDRFTSRALYGTVFLQKAQNLQVEGGRVYENTTVVVPLHGIVRPRRQIAVSIFTQAGVTGRLRVEIYYQPQAISKVELDALNLKYGKYRRGA